MNIAERAVIRPHLTIQSHWITYSYVAFTLVALAVIYLASAGPGFTEAELARTIAWP
ncbi:hypothetical protein ACVWZ4_007391 [Bradyrhizobium sp. USDA 4472]